MSSRREDAGRSPSAGRSAPADFWDERREARLRSLWADGRPATEIADALGITRNAVIGKAYRLGLAKRRAVLPRRGSGASGSRRSAEQPTTGNPRHWTPTSIAPTPLAVPLLELADGMCRFAAGDPQHSDFSFCGHQTVSGHSWCSYHCAIVYEPAEEMQSQERNAA